MNIITQEAKKRQAAVKLILKCFQEKFMRYCWDGVYDKALEEGYTRSFSGMVYAPLQRLSLNVVLYLLVVFRLICFISIDNAENIFVFLKKYLDIIYR